MLRALRALTDALSDAPDDPVAPNAVATKRNRTPFIFRDLEKVKAKAASYTSLTAYRAENLKDYKWLARHGHLDAVTGHMDRQVHREHTKESLMAIALQYPTRSAFLKAEPGAYYAAADRGWRDEVCAHMTNRRVHKKKGRGSKYDQMVEAVEVAKGYVDLASYRADHEETYQWAVKNGHIKKICGHLGSPAPRERTLEALREFAAGFPTRAAFRKGDYAAYRAAYDRGWLDEICAHMS